MTYALDATWHMLSSGMKRHKDMNKEKGHEYDADKMATT